jgi:hypothetical protein
MRNTRLKTRLRFALVLFAGTAASATACGKDFLVEDPPHIIVAENLYTSLSGFEAGINGLYAQVRRERQGINGLNDLMETLWVIGTDNGWGNFVSTAERVPNEYGIRNISTAGGFNDVWAWLYQMINGANTIIGRAENPAIGWSEADKNRILGEAHFIRGWAYRHLRYTFGPVPLNLTESNGSNIKTDWVRAPITEVNAQIETDLLFAEANLPATSTNPGKLTKAVAQHYLAELYLDMDNPVKAEEKATAVINSGLYSLVTTRYGVEASQPGVPFMDQFKDGNANRNQGNTEALWVWQWQQNVLGGGMNIMRRYWVNRFYNNRGILVALDNGGRGIGRLSPTTWALSIYEPTDDRGSLYAIRKFYLYNDPTNLPAGKRVGDTLKTRTLAVERASDALWPSTRKWDWVDPLNVNIDEQYNDQPYLRLADTYLLLAEAQFKQNNLIGAAASLNIVRARARATPITAAQVTLDFILDERSRELLTEEERRETLVRTHTLLARVKAHNGFSGPLIVARDTIFPIPQTVIDANTGRPMEQNPGY